MYKRQFESLGLSDSEVTHRIKQREPWYGIIDGMHRHKVIMELREEKPDQWGCFEWFVTVVKGGSSLHHYKQLARLQNLKHNDDYYVESTFYDILVGLKEEELKLKQEGLKNPSGPRIAEAFESSTAVSSSYLKQAATTVKRLSNAVIETIGEIMNTEIPEKSTSVAGIDESKYRNYSPNELMSRIDCRVYRRFIHLTSLKSSKAFMTAGEGKNAMDGIQYQLNTLHRAKHLSAENKYRPVQPEIITEQLSLSKNVSLEEEKFFNFHEENTWPVEFKVIQNNLLRNITFDEEIISNKGNDFTILPTILSKYKEVFPAVFHKKLSKFKLISCEEVNDVVDSNSSTQQENNNDSYSGLTTIPESQIDLPEEKSIDEVIDEKLLENNIAIHDMKWQEFAKSVFDENNTLFDAIVTDSPTNCIQSYTKSGNKHNDLIDDQEMTPFAQFCNKVLKAGSYVIMFTPLELFSSWIKAFKDSQFRCMSYPFIIMKDHSTMQYRNKTDFPQACCDFILLARSSGRHPSGFEPDFKTIYNNVCSASKKAFAGMFNVPATKSKLLIPGTKEPIRAGEKNVNLLLELISTYVADQGMVLDPYAGTFTTAIAASRVGRKSVCIERDDVCFELGRKTLSQLIGPLSCSQLMECNKRPLSVNANRYLDETPAKLLRSEQDDFKQPAELRSANKSNDVESESFATAAADEHTDTVQTLSFDTGDMKLGSQMTEKSDSDQIKNIHSVDDELKTFGIEGLDILAQCANDEDEYMYPSPGTEVDLLFETKIIGKATIFSNNGKYRRTLHGHNLKEFCEQNQNLVTVYNVVILDTAKDIKFPYRCPGVEKPSTLGSMIASAFYPWDLKSMK